jgi:hypothetical protein
MKNLRLGAALSLAFLVTLAVTAAVAGIGFLGVEKVGRRATRVLAVDARAAQLAEKAQALTLQLRRAEKDFLLNMGDANAQGNYASTWRKEQDALVATLGELTAVATDGSDRTAIEKAGQELARYAQGFRRLQSLVAEGKVATPQQGNAELAAYKDSIRALTEAAGELAARHAKGMGGQARLMEEAMTATNATLAVLLVVALAAAIAIAVAMTRFLARQVARLVGEAARLQRAVAEGALDVRGDVAGVGRDFAPSSPA